MTRVKICGITTLEDAFIAVEAGADMLGFNFYPPSPRYLTPAACRAITDDLRAQLGASCPLLIGVFVNEPAAGEIVTQAGLDYAQLHGDESPEALAALAGRAFKAIRPRTVEEVAAQAAVRSTAWPSARNWAMSLPAAKLPSIPSVRSPCWPT